MRVVSPSWIRLRFARTSMALLKVRYNEVDDTTMNSVGMPTPIKRVVEPFVKAAFANWLVQHGARKVTVSIDGMEKCAEEFPKYLDYLGGGYEFIKSFKSKTNWAGIYTHRSGVVVRVRSMPGLDVQATLKSHETLVAECKGEPTDGGIKTGRDLTNLYCCLGQLMVFAGQEETLPDRRFLVVPKSASEQFCETICRLGTNPLIVAAGIEIAEVDRSGQVAVQTQARREG